MWTKSTLIIEKINEKSKPKQLQKSQMKHNKSKHIPVVPTIITT